MAATLMLACSNDKSGGHDGDEGVETEVNGTQLDGNTTLYGLVTDTSGNPIPGVVVSDGYGCVTTDANGVYQMERYKKARFVHYSTPAGYAINTSADNYPLFYAEIVHKNIADRHDFVLTPLPAPESDFTLVCIADPQCATTAAAAAADIQRRHANRAGRCMASSASIRALSRRSMASQRSPVAGEMSVLCALHTAATSKNRLRFFSEASSQAYTSRSSAPLVRRTRYLYSSPSMSVMVGVSVWRSNMYTFRVLPILYSHRHKNT